MFYGRYVTIKVRTMRCSVFGCNSDNESKKNPCPNVKFFTFPKDPIMRKKWLHLTKRKDNVNLKYAVVCSRHFCESDFKVNLKHTLLNYTPKNYRGLRDDAIPSQNLYQSQVASVALPSTSGERRKHVYEKRQRAKLVQELLKTENSSENR